MHAHVQYELVGSFGSFVISAGSRAQEVQPRGAKDLGWRKYLIQGNQPGNSETNRGNSGILAPFRGRISQDLVFRVLFTLVARGHNCRAHRLVLGFVG